MTKHETEKMAQKINRTPAQDSVQHWMCEECGTEWDWPEDKDFDRTTDTQNWPVLCDTCIENSLMGA